MRMIGRLLLLLLTIGLLSAVWGAASEGIRNFTNQGLEPWEEDYENSIVYILHQGETFTFEVPNEARQLRILHSPIGLSEFDEDAELVLENEENIQINQQYSVFLQSQSSLETTANQLPERFLDSPQGAVAGLTQAHVISFLQEQNFDRFSLTLKKSSRPIAIRVSYLETYDESSVDRVWQRLNGAQKQAMFNDHIYPVELIPIEERKALLMQRWQPIGPTASSAGVLTTQTLFVHSEADIQNSEFETINELSVVGPKRWYTLDTRAASSPVAFSCARLSGEGEVNLELSTVDADGELLTSQIGLTSATEQVVFPTLLGLYKISADQRCELTFYDPLGEVVVQDYNYLRAAVVLPIAPVLFDLVPESELVQPLRLDARLLTDETAILPVNLVADWSITDEQGKLLLKGQLPLISQVNPYQLSVDASLTRAVHEKAELYIVAPPEAANLQVSVAEGALAEGVELLVNLYTRPENLPYRVNIAATDDPDDEAVSLWFLARPSPVTQNTPAPTELLTWQLTLPEVVEPSVESEQWYSLESVSDKTYVELFVAEETAQLNADVPEQGNALSYLPIQVQESIYSVTAEDHTQQVRPQLVYERADATPAPIEITLNGELIRRDWISSRTGRLYLPDLSQGDYRLAISAPAQVNWFSNYQVVENNDYYRLRNAHRIDSSLSFDVSKIAEEEWVSFNYFPATKETHQVKIRLEKTAKSGVFPGYTVSERIFTIPAATEEAKVNFLFQQQAPIWQPKRLPFLLGSDLDSGSYRISVSSTVPESGYIQAGYLAAPPDYQIEISTEDSNALF